MKASSLSPSRPSRFQRVRASMSPSEWRRAGGMVAVIAWLHVVGFGLLILVVVPAKYKLGAAGRSRSERESPPTRWACATPLTPTTSRRSITPHGSS